MSVPAAVSVHFLDPACSASADGVGIEAADLLVRVDGADGQVLAQVRTGPVRASLPLTEQQRAFVLSQARTGRVLSARWSLDPVPVAARARPAGALPAPRHARPRHAAPVGGDAV